MLGLGAEWFITWDADHRRGGKRLFRAENHAEPLVPALRRKLGLQGPGISLSAACASGNYALAQARRWLQLGWVDVCLAGACDARCVSRRTVVVMAGGTLSGASEIDGAASSPAN